MAEDRAHRRERVIDFKAFKDSKARFGKGLLVEHNSNDHALTAHEDAALHVGNPDKGNK